MNDRIKDLKYMIQNQRVTIQLPPTTENLFFHYGWEINMVKPYEFLINSLKHFLKENGNTLQEGDIQEVSLNTRFTFKVFMPIRLWIKLKLLSYRLHLSCSAIVNEALGYSLPELVEIEQAQEDYMFEQAEYINSTSYTEN